MNYIILYAASIILKIKPKVIRLVISSVIGSIYAIIIYITEIPIYTSIITKIILSAFNFKIPGKSDFVSANEF